MLISKGSDCSQLQESSQMKAVMASRAVAYLPLAKSVADL